MENYQQDTYFQFSIGILNFTVLRLSSVPFSRPIPQHQHSKNGYEIHYVLEGKGCLVIDSKQEFIFPNDLIVTGPGIMHEIIPGDEGLREFCFYVVVKSENSLAMTAENQEIKDLWISHTVWKTNIKEPFSTYLKQLNQANILDYFPEQLFFTYESFSSKEEAIHEIINECKKSYDLPADFEQYVLQREALATTEFNDLIAFPHSNKPVSNATFVAVTILKKPLLWKKHKIRIILLSAIENKAIKELDDFYKIISNIISDSTIQWNLINNPNYQYFKEIIERLERL